MKENQADQPFVAETIRTLQSHRLMSDVIDAECWIVKDDSEVVAVGQCCVANFVTKPRDVRLD